jgi:hypothetical protein
MLTLFSFGYHGWGNATDRLIEVVDAVEASRGYDPPLFVDTRIRRSVRAVGFNGPAFEKLLGPERHRWMPALGNRHILTRQGPFIQIADPAAAEDLLDLALAAARRRLLFFCSCPWPRQDGQIACHRAAIAGLVLEAARRRGIALEVIEWPGGGPVEYPLNATPQQAQAARSRVTLPLGAQVNLAEVGALPWGSCLRLSASTRLTGPARWQPRGWALPLLQDEPVDALDWRTTATGFRQRFGLQAYRA